MTIVMKMIMFIFLIIVTCTSALAVKMNEEIQFDGNGTINAETNGESVYDKVNGHGEDQQYSRELTTFGYGQAKLTSIYMYKNTNKEHQNDINYTGSYSAGLIMPDGIHHSLSVRSNRSINSTSIISYENGDMDSGSTYFDIETKFGNLSESVRDYSRSIPSDVASTTLTGNFTLINELDETYIKSCTNAVLLKELNDVEMRGLNIPRTISTKGPQTIIIEGKEASDDVQASYMQSDAARELENATVEKNKGHYEKARDLYMSALGLSEKGLELDQSDPYGWINKAGALIGLNETNDAVRAYGEAINLDPENVQAISGKALALYKMGIYGQSLSWFSKVLELDKTNYKNWYYYASALLKSAKYELALSSIDKSLELKRDYDSLLLKGMILYASKNWAEAVTQFDEGIQESPYKGMYIGRYYYYQGMAYYNLKEYENASNSFLNAKELDPSSAEDVKKELMLCENHLNSEVSDEIKNAIDEQNKGNYERAEDLYESALGKAEMILEININSTSGWINKGDALSGLNSTEDAATAYGEAIERDSNNIQANLGKALALFKMKDYPQSLNYFNNVTSLDPENATYWYYYADALNESAKYELALNSINKSLELRRDYRGLLLKAMILYSSGNWTESVTQFNDGFQESPNIGADLGRYYYYQGMAYYNLNEWENAINSFNKAMELDPGLTSDAKRMIAQCEKNLNSSSDAGTAGTVNSGSISVPAINASAISTP